MVDHNLVGIYAAPLITLIIGFLINKYFQSKSRIIAYYSHFGTHKISRDDQDPLSVYTHTIVIRNVGGKSANNVTLTHANLPDFYTHPDIRCTTNSLPNGGMEIVFPIIVPREEITISYIYFSPMTKRDVNTQIKSDEGLGSIIEILPSPELSTWKKSILHIFLFLGFSLSIYWLIYFLYFFYQKII